MSQSEWWRASSARGMGALAVEKCSTRAAVEHSVGVGSQVASDAGGSAIKTSLVTAS
jgi:hypothetical protein